MSDRSLVEQLRRSFRVVTLGIGATLGLTVVLIWALLLRTHPEIERLTDLTRELRLSHEAMLDQDQGLRAWLVTGDTAYLERVETGRVHLDSSDQRLAALVGDDTEMISRLVDLRVAQERWTTSWADAADEVETTSQSQLNRFLAEGRADLEPYRDAYATAVEHSSRERDRAVDLERNVLAGGILAEALICAALLAAARRERRRVEGSVVEPLDELISTMRRVGEGDLTARPTPGGPKELRQVAEGLADMTEALAGQQALIATREAEAVASGARLQEILDLARDVAGSLSLRYVSESVAAAAARVSGAHRVVIWLHEGDDDLVAVHETGGPRGREPALEPVPLGAGTVGLAARDARTVVGADGGATVVAMPMVVGARVVGVIEMVDSPIWLDGTTEALETLSIHAGAALEAARLHQQTEALSQMDALTGLLNRRRLERDLSDECERSQRYHRPLSFIMLDVDHFKALNDSRGHQHGDEVLQRLARLLTEHVRTSDTVYRYGGEEFAVLVRESDEDDAAHLAERLREALERTMSTTEGFSRVTASFGVAETGPGCDAPTSLVEAADAALYDAKRSGRNRVVTHRLRGDAATKQAPSVAPA